jgi:mono/diheme cytochrome c family protein
MRLVRMLLLAGLAAGAVLALVLATVASSAGHDERVRGAHGQTVELTPAEARGREQFASHCSGCHTLRAVHAVSQVGPDLDFVRPPAAVVRRRIHEGSEAATAVMPPEIVTGSDAADVAAFVARAAGR